MTLNVLATLLEAFSIFHTRAHTHTHTHTGRNDIALPLLRMHTQGNK